jgi:hypothetical protein
MPSRILRDWTDSEPINELSAQAEVFYVRLIMKADDFGLFHANPKLLRSLLFPLKDGIRETDISRWLAECEKAGLIRPYTVDEKSYLEIVKFGQRLQQKRSKFPLPPQINSESQLKTVENGNKPPEESRISSLSHLDSETTSESYAEAEMNALPFPSEKFKKAWERWIEYRKSIKKPINVLSVRPQFNKFMEWGESLSIELIDNAIMRQWKGIIRPDDWGNPNGGHSSANTGHLNNSQPPSNQSPEDRYKGAWGKK